MRRNMIGAHVLCRLKGGVYLVGLSATDATFLIEKAQPKRSQCRSCILPSGLVFSYRRVP
jgi:hypothetical protein